MVDGGNQARDISAIPSLKFPVKFSRFGVKFQEKFQEKFGEKMKIPPKGSQGTLLIAIQQNVSYSTALNGVAGFYTNCSVVVRL